MDKHLFITKREVTNVACTDEQWELLCDLFLGSYNDTITFFVSEDEDAWEELKEKDEKLYFALLELCENNDGIAELSQEV